jgi:DNA polymerase-3 subunit gamma/tau
MSTERIHQSLANKYRPRTFDELVEQEIVVDILKAQVLGGNTHSNFVFFGPRGTGKTSVARIFAKALNCPNIIENKGNPCNLCSHCEMINQSKAMDVVEIDAASYTGVDTIREEIIEKA